MESKKHMPALMVLTSISDKMGVFKNKKSISSIVSVTIILVLVFVIAAIVFNVTNPLVKQQLEKTKTCYEIFDKVFLNRDYTCYNEENKSLNFFIEIKDIEIDELLIGINLDGSSKSYRIPTQTEGLIMKGAEEVVLPPKNGGRLYVSTEITSKPSSIKIAPVINGETCSITDSISKIPECSNLPAIY